MIAGLPSVRSFQNAELDVCRERRFEDASTFELHAYAGFLLYCGSQGQSLRVSRVERLNRTQEVARSSPPSPIKDLHKQVFLFMRLRTES